MQGMSSEDDLTTKDLSKNVESTVPPEEEEPRRPVKPDALSTSDEAAQDPVSPAEIPQALAGSTDSTTVNLLPKILRTTKMYFASGNFYFSYEYDLSHNIGQQQPNSSLPLHKQYDPLVRKSTSEMMPYINP